MTFLPGGDMLVTEKPGRLLILSADGKQSISVSGVPKVAYGKQGGLADVILHPDYSNNGFIYLSYAEPGPGGSGTAVARAKLVTQAGGVSRLDGLQVIWRQEPKVSGEGHYSGRMAFSPDGYLFITSGERQKFTPAQDMGQNLGKVIRLSDAGGIPSTNPYYDTNRIKAQIWSSGHRNLLGIAFDGRGRLWTDEMGPRGGDELNQIERGGNYGWPIVSNGDHYDGRDIPDHPTRPEFTAPAVFWNPVISPSSLIFYSGGLFPQWRGSALIGGLSSESLVRVMFDGDKAREADRFPMGKRIREVEQGPDGAVWLLEDGKGGRLLKLTRP
jgi:glucose/arabinose dehydrogenase